MRTGEQIKCSCLFCNKITKHKVGYMGSFCLECELEMFDFDSYDDVYKHIKRKYKLERKDVARILNLSPKTISTYQHSNVLKLVRDLLNLHHKGLLEVSSSGRKE